MLTPVPARIFDRNLNRDSFFYNLTTEFRSASLSKHWLS